MFVQRMGGQIWALNNQDGLGATFFFCLPLACFAQGISNVVEQPESIKVTQPKNRKVQFQKHRGQPVNEGGFIPERNQRDGSGGLPHSPSLKDNSDGDTSTEMTADLSSSWNSSVTSSQWNSCVASIQGEDCFSVYQHRVLVVDDILINRKILDRMLKQLGFTKLATVGSGMAALEELHRHRYDLVITDLQMPGMSGIELCEVIHKIDDENFQTPVVVGLTADTSLETVERCKCSGMSDVIHKPMTVKDLRDFLDRKISVMIEENRKNFWNAKQHEWVPTAA